jgi:hypothetical protein
MFRRVSADCRREWETPFWHGTVRGQWLVMLADACDAMALHVEQEDDRIRRAVEAALQARLGDDGR